VSVAYFITHPEVVVDAGTPVPQWHLSDKGVHRMRDFASRHDPGKLSAVWASTGTKAIEAAGILAGHFGLPDLDIAPRFPVFLRVTAST
jgi:broad specificity phosphatase PhoE